MPLFSYRALDSTGRLVNGVIDAPTENELIQSLSSQGLRIQALTRSAAQPAGAPPVVNQPAQNFRPLQQVQQPQAAGVHAPQQQTQRPLIAPVLSGPPVRTKRASRIDLHFTFANISNLVRAGFGAAEIFTELANRATKQHLKDAFSHIASTATSGQTLAGAMARYPDIFPEGAVGAVRAGETGGYLPEACERLATQFRDDHRVAWKVRIMRWVIATSILEVPFGMASIMALDKVFSYYNSRTDAPPSVPERIRILSNFFWESMAGLPGIIILVYFVSYICAALWLKRTENRPLRHRWALKVPLVTRYGANECLSALGWHLSKLSAAGIAPARAWQLAARAVPNIEFAQRAAAASLNTNESAKMSDLARRSGLFPQDHQSLMFTGELSGSLPQALEQSSELASGELQHNRTFMNYAFFSLAFLIMAVLSAIAFVTFYGGYVDSLLGQEDKVEQDL